MNDRLAWISPGGFHLPRRGGWLFETQFLQSVSHLGVQPSLALHSLLELAGAVLFLGQRSLGQLRWVNDTASGVIVIERNRGEVHTNTPPCKIFHQLLEVQEV